MLLQDLQVRLAIFHFLRKWFTFGVLLFSFKARFYPINVAMRSTALWSGSETTGCVSSKGIAEGRSVQHTEMHGATLAESHAPSYERNYGR